MILKDLNRLGSTSRKQSLIISILILLSFTIFNGISYFLLSDLFFKYTTTENMNYTESVGKSVASYIQNAYNITQEIALSNEVTSMDTAKQKQAIDNTFSRYSFIDNLSIQKTSDGNQVARAKGDSINKAERWWFKKILTDKNTFVSSSYYTLGTTLATNYAITSIYFPIYNENNYVGIFATDLKLDMLQDYIKRFSNDNNIITYILDGNGTIIAHPDSTQMQEMYNYKTAKKTLLVKDVDGNPIIENGNQKLEDKDIAVPKKLTQIIEKVLQGESGTDEYTDLAGNRMLASYYSIKLPGTSDNWAIVSVENKNLALAPVKNIFIVNILIAIILLLFLMDAIMKQKRQLLNAQQKILSTHTELQELNASLEEEINERTQLEIQVSAANEELTAMNEEMLAMNEELSFTNTKLEKEVAERINTERELILREHQYAVTTSILVHADDEKLLLPMILNDALDLLRVTNGYIALANDVQNTLHLDCAKGIFESLIGKELPTDKGMYVAAYSSGKLMYVEDYFQYPDKLSNTVLDKIKSVLMVPLKRKDQVIGVLVAAWADQIHYEKKQELDVWQQYGDFASIAFEKAETRAQIRHSAYYDGLTDLPNRYNLKEKLERELTAVDGKKAAGAAMFIDLDDFKIVNDTFGHTYGDDIIIRAGEIITDGAGPDAFIARIGGDEFIVLFPNEQDRNQVKKIADKMINLLNMTYQLREISVQLSASIGIIMYPENGNTFEEILKNADTAMYVAKKTGKNHWKFYEDSMQEDVYERVVLTNSLRNALKNGELSLHYQPQVNIQNSSIIGFEALLRCTSPEHGIVLPSRFIPIAEQSGLIYSIGEWVLRETCRYARRLADIGFKNCSVAANVSPNQLATDNFIEIVHQAIFDAGIEPCQLEIEITESTLLQSFDEGVEKLEKIKAMGVRLSLDDFGTGYSSLSYLQLLPVETLKLDKSFIDRILVDSHQSIIVKSIIEMAHALNLKVIAEGVEIEAQYNFLIECNCDCVQGYFISKPIPEEEATKYLCRGI